MPRKLARRKSGRGNALLGRTHGLEYANSEESLRLRRYSLRAGRPWTATERPGASYSPQRPAYSLQSLAEHFRVHSHADAEVIGQTEKMSGHG